MYNYSKQVEKLIGRLGWRNSPPPYLSDFVLDDTNKKSASGMFFDYVGSLATVKNVHNMYNVPINSIPELNAILLDLQKQTINTVLHDVFSEDTEILDSYNLFPFQNVGLSERTLEAGNFHCFEINPYHNDFSIIIEKVFLLFDSAVTFDLYLFNSNNTKTSTAVVKQSVTTKAYESTEIELVDFICDTSAGGGYWYLGYFSDEIGGAKPLDHEFRDYISSDNYGSISRETVPVSTIPAGTFLSLGSITNDPDGNGMNPHITVAQNYSGFISNNKSLFDKAIQTQMHISVSELILNSTRTDCDQDELQQAFNTAWLRLYGDPSKQIYKTDRVLLNKEIKNIKSALFDSPLITVSSLKT